MDDDGNTALNYEEFDKGIRETGLNLSNEQTRHLFSRFDTDDSGTIDMTEFLIAVRVSVYKRNVYLIHNLPHNCVIVQLRNSCHVFHTLVTLSEA